jgi:cell wall-associated NlpC family hydrolase
MKINLLIIFVSKHSMNHHFIKIFSVFVILVIVLYSCGSKKTIQSTKTKMDYKKSNDSNISKTKFDLSKLKDKKLRNFASEWLGVPYKYSGKTKEGIDCSHFTCTLLRDVFQFPKDFYLPSYRLPEKFTTILKDQVKEGDLVFFDIQSNGKISHVGIMLDKSYFIHASTSKGVVINSLEEAYYQKRVSYFGATENNQKVKK